MKYIKELQEFLDDELGDYSIKYEIEYIDGSDGEYYNVLIKDNYGEKPIGKGDVSFHLYKEKGNVIIEIELSEDSWEKIETFDRTIKYFWMALLWI